MSPKKRSLLRFLTSRRGLARLIFAGCIIGAVICLIYGTWAAIFDLEEVSKMPQRSAVYDMDGNYYSRLRGENRVVVPAKKVSRHFINALLAREDTRFYKHRGVDAIGIFRAMVRNAAHLSIKEGGSTLTQQLARNTFPLGGQTLHRKLLEAFVALRMERHYAKQEILEHYVNRIYFGYGFWGVETASQAYFGKPAASLNLSESAMLVGIIRSPNRLSPFKNLETARRERDAVLARMKSLRMITAQEEDRARRTKIAVQRRSRLSTQENFAMDAVNRDLEFLLEEDQFEEGGVRIYTTIDPKLQKAAETALEQHLRSIEGRPGYPHPKRSQFSAAAKKNEEETPYLQGAVLVIDNRTGGIRAIVGGRDYTESKFNRALIASRQIGSTFKPFVYAAAFERGLKPSTLIDDARIQPNELRTVGAGWSPENSDGKYNGPMPAEDGLIESRNTMSVRVGDFAGFDAVERVAHSAGLSEIPRNPAAFLGAFESNLKDVTMAYTVFPNGGVRKQPYVIERIDDDSGNVLYRAAHLQAAALDPGTTLLVSSALQEVLERGTAAAARRLGFKSPAGGKTGTTNDFRDAWFVGYTSTLTCGVWVGLDHPATIIPRGYGSSLALPVWTQTMKAASPQKYPAEPLARVFTERRTIEERDRRPSFPDRVFDSFRRLFRGR